MGWVPTLRTFTSEYTNFFRMPEEDEEECIKTLKLNGVDISKQWVCILARDNEYLKRTQKI